MACIDADNFAYIGTHPTGTAKADYLVAVPGWEGTVPDGVLDVLPRSRTPELIVLGRTQALSADDVCEANKIQEKYRVTPLSVWPEIYTPPKRDAIDPHSFINPTENTEGTWISMNRAMTKNPPGVPPGIDQTELLTLFATIGVGPNQSWENQSDDTKRGLHRAAKDGLPMLRKMAKGRGKIVNGWAYPPRDIGMAGQNSDFITRAALQALGGIIAHNSSEAVYINTATDSNGETLNSDYTYQITFEDEAAFPPFDPTYSGFWSLTIYQSSDFNLVEGSKAYSINSYYLDFSSRDKNGGMTIYIQQAQPDNYKSNGVYWLQPPPKNESDPTQQNFYLILRVYVPGPELSYTQTWAPPPIVKTGTE
jgi:hypothetical protein